MSFNSIGKMAAIVAAGVAALMTSRSAHQPEVEVRSPRRKFKTHDLNGSEDDLLDKGFRPGSSKRSKRRKAGS